MENQHEEKVLLSNDDQEIQLIKVIDQALMDLMVIDSPASDTYALDVQGCHGETSGANIGSSFTSRPIPPFLLKIYDMLSNEETNSFVTWNPTGTSFIINNPHNFAANILPMYFRHNNFQSFVTQLNSYGFKKISWEQWEYKNEYFQKGARHLLRNIKRRNQIHQIVQQPDSGIELSLIASPSSSNKESDTSMKEYNLLKNELMKLKEKQQTLDEKLASLKYKVVKSQRDQSKMMVAAHRILSILHEPSNAKEPMMDDDNETHVKGKMKLGETTMCSDDVLGSCSGASKAKVAAESNYETLVGEETRKHPESTFIPLEDLIGESECIKFIKELQGKINHPKF